MAGNASTRKILVGHAQKRTRVPLQRRELQREKKGLSSNQRTSTAEGSRIFPNRNRKIKLRGKRSLLASACLRTKKGGVKRKEPVFSGLHLANEKRPKETGDGDRREQQCSQRKGIGLWTRRSPPKDQEKITLDQDL